MQLHNNGEPLLYPHLMEALRLFTGHYVGLNTNGKLLLEQNEAIRAHLSTITVSIIPDDPEGWTQLWIVGEFLEYEVRPLVIFRLLGNIDEGRRNMINGWCERYSKAMVCHRILHSPDGSYDYEKRTTKPEIGGCLEMLHRLAIDRHGDIFPCVRFDPHKKNLFINMHDQSLDWVWNCKTRKQWIHDHIEGRRDLVPLCKDCDFWGVPRG